MYYLIKKNQKKLLAVFGVLLMVVFIIPPAAKYGATRGNVVVGHVGQTPIYQTQMSEAKEEWAWLNRIGGRMPLPAMVIYQEIIHVNPAASHDFQAQMGAFQLGRQITDAINQHPEMFLLLQQEAAANGLTISRDQANEFLKNQIGIDVTNDEQGALQTAAVQHLLMVTSQLHHLMSALKVSQPAWQYNAAGEQAVRLSLVDFRVSDFIKSVPAPTTQQVQQQFEKYKDLPPGEASASNPLGFGYQIPTRVKLQYLEIPRQQVIESVIHNIAPPGGSADASGDNAYAWEVQAALYYDKHQEEYKNPPPPATQPTTQPATQSASASQPATQPATQPVASTEPAIKPFGQVKQQIIEKLAADEVEKQTKAITDDLFSKLKADFDVISKADPQAIKPAVQPTTRPTSDLMMLSHLEVIRTQIEQKHHVAIQLHEIVNDWQTAPMLGKLPGIGESHTKDGEPFADYATSFARPGVAPLQVWLPSEPLTSADQNTYLFRLTAAEPAHAPANPSSIAKQLEEDWKTGQAYDQAKKAAQAALDTAKTAGIDQAARNASQNVIATPLFPPGQVRQIPGYPLLDPEATRDLTSEIADLLRQATPTDKHPDKLVELPKAQRVVVMELSGVQLTAPEWQAQLAATGMLQQMRLQRLAQEWFQYDAVVARNAYKAEEKS